MRHRFDIFSLIAVLVALVGCGGAASGPAQNDPTASGQFEEPGDSDETTRLSGKALTPEGEPVSAASVYLRKDSEVVERTDTAEDGTFSMESAPSGEVQVVLNDGRGHGAMEEMTLYAGGTNEIGEIALQPFTDLPDIVDVHGIGFEERVSTTGGNLRFPIFNSDASKVYAAKTRKEDADPSTTPEPSWTVVEIDTATGAENVLARAADIERRFGWPDSPIFVLVEDRYLAWKYNDNPVGMALKIYDVKKDELVVDTTSTGTSLRHGAVPVTSETIVVPISHEVKPVRRATYGKAKRLQFYKFDADTGTLVEGPSPGPTWTSKIDIVGVNDDILVYSFEPVCRDDDGFVKCGIDRDHDGEREGDGRRRIRALHLDDMTTSTIAIGKTVVAIAVAPNSPVVFWSNDPPSAEDKGTIIRENVETGRTAKHTFRGCGDRRECTSPGLRVGRSKDDVYVTWDRNRGSGTTTYQGTYLGRLNFQTDNLKQLEPVVQTGSSTIPICTKTASCEFEVRADGRLQVRSAVERSGDDSWRALVDFEDGKQVASRLFELPETDDSSGGLDVVTAENSGVEALKLRQTSGFFQYLVRAENQQSRPNAFRQRTFLQAQHHHAAFTPDGSSLYYFTRDPLSGYFQLFRLQVGAVPGSN